MAWPRSKTDCWDELILALRCERQRQGLSIIELEERCGFSRNHIEKLENGVHRPTGFILVIWAMALGYTLQLVPAHEAAIAPEYRPPDRIRRRLPRAEPLTP